MTVLNKFNKAFKPTQAPIIQINSIDNTIRTCDTICVINNLHGNRISFNTKQKPGILFTFLIECSDFAIIICNRMSIHYSQRPPMQ